MHLKAGEGELQSGKVTIKEFIVGGQSSKDMLGGLEGTLHLTNFRLVAEKPDTSGEADVIFEFPLEALQDVEIKGVFNKAVNLQADLPKMKTAARTRREGLQKGRAHFTLKLDDPKAWAGQLSKAITSRNASR